MEEKKCMKKILIDTDIFIDFLRGKKLAYDFFKKMIISDKVVTFSSVITEIELLSGKECENLSKRNKVETLLLLTNRIDIDQPIIVRSADFKIKYNLSVPDAIISATAYRAKSLLVTRNVKDFKKVKEVKLYVPY